MKEKNINGFKYTLLKSSEIQEKEKNDYIDVINSVFHANFTCADFNKKYCKNIYGDSWLVIVYEDVVPVAVRAFWRNDICDIKAFQPCDTAVKKEFRGNGIFWNMTSIVLNEVKNEIIYNYPNNNSRKLYLKHGWEIQNEYFLNLFFCNSSYEKNNGDLINDAYFYWWFKDRKDIYKFKRGKKYYLLRERKKHIYIIIGQITNEIYNIPEIKNIKLGIVLYRSLKDKFYSTSTVYSIVHGDNTNLRIPLYKMDAT